VRNLNSEILEFSSDGFTLRGILTRGSSSIEKGALVLHPHPLYGGNMNNPVVLILENTLLEAGYATLRFDFRGTSASPEGYDGVAGAVKDASNAANLFLSRNIHEFGIAGYSFGGSTALRLAIEKSPLFLVTLSASSGLVSEGNFDITHLSRIHCPTLMFHGQDDQMVSSLDIELLSRLIGSDNVETVILEQEGHFYQRSMERVVRKLSNFLVHFMS
jgi:alpha/beta superfamily hydrolase